MSKASLVQRITLAAERPDLEAVGRQFCTTMLPNVDINTMLLPEFSVSMQEPHSSDELLVLVLHADAHGHLLEGVPIVQELMTSRVPVLVLRQPEDTGVPERVINRIMVPLDGSATAGQAISLASRVARAHNVPVKFVMVIDPARVIPPAYAYDPEAWSLIEDLRQTSHWALSQAETLMHRDGVEVSSDLLFGSVIASLCTSIGDGDLVVMTTHGLDRHGLRYPESVAMRILVSISQPILIKRAQPQPALIVDSYQACNWIEPLNSDEVRSG